MNYFNYFTEIEDTFIRRRGKHLLLSPIDWALIETWKQIGVPLHVVLRGIERSFDSWETKPRKRSVKSLLYCQEEVEAQYAEWLEARVGGTTNGDSAEHVVEEADDSLSFSRRTVLEYLEHLKVALGEAAKHRKQVGEDNLTEALERGLSLLAALTDDFATANVADTRKLEDSLTGLERMVTEALHSIVAADDLESIRGEVVKQLQPYRAHMDTNVYQQTLDNLLLKRLRENFGVPRLSLFYL